MKKTLLALSMAFGAAAAQAEEPQSVTVTLSSGSTMTQGMAMVLANQMQEQNAQVDILLCDEAGKIALKNAAGETLKPNNVTPTQLLDAAIKKGATASVCALFLPNSGYNPDDLREGVSVARPQDIAAKLLEPNRKHINF